MNTCIQCGADAPEPFCSNCGQKQSIPRLTIKTFLGDFFSRIYGLDGAFPRTVIGLAIRPAIAIEEYIKGVRGKYIGPVGYYFLLYGVFVLLFKVYGIEMTDYFNVDTFNESLRDVTGEEITDRQQQAQQELQRVIYSAIQFVTLLLFPFWSIFAKWIFRKSGYLFIENMVFSFYVHAQMIFINMFGLTLFVITGYSFQSVDTVLGLIYLAICGSLFYHKKISFKGIAKSLLTYGLSFLGYMLIFSILGTLYFFIQGKF